MENGSSNGGIGAAIRAPTISENHQLLPTSPRSQLNGYDLGGHYTSSFFPAADSLPNSSYISLCQSPSSCEDEAPNSTENRLYLARLMLQNQQLAERYSLCLSHLRETVQEAEALRQENADLRNTIGDMTKRMGLLSLSGKQNPQKSRVGSSGYQLQSVMDNLRSCVGDAGKNGLVTGEGSEASPTSVLGFEENRFQRAAGPERVALPKSISVRSSGFLKVNQAAAADNGASSSRAGRPRERSPVTVPSQRVYVPGGKAGDGCLEMEVYNQGMFKTELCNKWQETGTCPYGEHCQFAHGIEELRPVIRHPRYKTEVCRMVLSGDKCPYGHRCHFRHALTEQEKGLDSA